jgi:fatty-acid desaturase
MFMYLTLRLTSETPHGRLGHRAEAGQATAEYALVILGAATLAGLVLAWAAGTGRVSRLLNAVLDSVIGQVV